jgi:hypothetical protein
MSKVVMGRIGCLLLVIRYPRVGGRYVFFVGLNRFPGRQDEMECAAGLVDLGVPTLIKL